MTSALLLPAPCRAAELARLSGSAAPSTPADYERLALASPSSSFVWIKYMAFHISLGDIDAARKVAQRALDTINYRWVWCVGAGADWGSTQECWY